MPVYPGARIPGDGPVAPSSPSSRDGPVPLFFYLFSLRADPDRIMPVEVEKMHSFRGHLLAAFLGVVTFVPASAQFGQLSRSIEILKSDVQLSSIAESQIKTVTDARRALLESIENQQKTATANQESAAATPAVLRAAEVTKAAQEVVDRAQVTPQVTVAQRSKLESAILGFQQSAEKERDFYSRLATALTVAGLLLALGAGIASFMSWSKAAGIASIVVGAVIAAPKAFPVNERAEFNRILSAQSYSLLQETRLQLSMTEVEYNSTLKRLSLLGQYATDKFPTNGNSTQAVQDLLKDLRAAQTPKM